MKNDRNGAVAAQAQPENRTGWIVLAWLALAACMTGGCASMSALPGMSGAMFNVGGGGESGVGRELGSAIGMGVGGKAGYAGSVVGGLLGSALEKGAQQQAAASTATK